MTLRKKKQIITVCGAAGILAAILGQGLVMLLGLAVFLASAFLDTRWRRCPYCGKKLNRYQMEYCSGCGHAIDLDAKPGEEAPEE